MESLATRLVREELLSAAEGARLVRDALFRDVALGGTGVRFVHGVLALSEGADVLEVAAEDGGVGCFPVVVETGSVVLLPDGFIALLVCGVMRIRAY